MVVNYKANNYVDRTSANTIITHVLQYNTGVNPILSPTEMAKSTDFDILMDKVYAIGGTTYAYKVDGSGGYTIDTGTTIDHYKFGTNVISLVTLSANMMLFYQC